MDKKVVKKPKLQEPDDAPPAKSPDSPLATSPTQTPDQGHSGAGDAFPGEPERQTIGETAVTMLNTMIAPECDNPAMPTPAFPKAQNPMQMPIVGVSEYSQSRVPKPVLSLTQKIAFAPYVPKKKVMSSGLFLFQSVGKKLRRSLEEKEAREKLEAEKKAAEKKKKKPASKESAKKEPASKEAAKKVPVPESLAEGEPAEKKPGSEEPDEKKQEPGTFKDEKPAPGSSEDKEEPDPKDPKEKSGSA